jgi:hypothetical protein
MGAGRIGEDVLYCTATADAQMFQSLNGREIETSEAIKKSEAVDQSQVSSGQR